MEKALTHLKNDRRFPKPLPEVLTMAFQVGVHQIKREHVLGQYSLRDLSHDQVIEAVNWIGLDERKQKARVRLIDGRQGACPHTPNRVMLMIWRK